MTIEKVTCPVITSHDDGHNPQVFVRFDDRESPFGIMCPYHSDVHMCTLNGLNCTYSKWKLLSS
jgi:hypothetical protein